MKIYSATKFSIIIVPPKLSEKTKESKLLVMSFRHIYKVAGLGIAIDIPGLFSLSMLGQDNSIPVTNTGQFPSVEESEMVKSIPRDESTSLTSTPALSADPESQLEFNNIKSQYFSQSDLEEELHLMLLIHYLLVLICLFFLLCSL
ncbi:MAG: hypothetical protein ACRBB5_06570 [Nitrosopumilus sp.]